MFYSNRASKTLILYWYVAREIFPSGLRIGKIYFEKPQLNGFNFHAYFWYLFFWQGNFVNSHQSEIIFTPWQQLRDGCKYEILLWGRTAHNSIVKVRCLYNLSGLRNRFPVPEALHNGATIPRPSPYIDFVFLERDAFTFEMLIITHGEWWITGAREIIPFPFNLCSISRKHAQHKKLSY